MSCNYHLYQLCIHWPRLYPRVGETHPHKLMHGVLFTITGSATSKNGVLLHGKGDPIRCRRTWLDRDPQVLLGVARTLFLLHFWPGCLRGLSVAAVAAAATALATTAAVAAHHQGGEEDQQGESQEDHQADGVEQSLVVFVRGEAPNLVEELLDAVCHALHGFLSHRIPAPLNQARLGSSRGLLNPYFYLLNPSHGCEVVISGQYN